MRRQRLTTRAIPIALSATLATGLLLGATGCSADLAPQTFNTVPDEASPVAPALRQWIETTSTEMSRSHPDSVHSTAFAAAEGDKQ